MRRIARGFWVIVALAACHGGGPKSRPAPARAPGKAAVGDTTTRAVTPPGAPRPQVGAADTAKAKTDSAATPPAPTPAPAKPPVPDKPGERCVMDLENTPETRSQSVQDPVSSKYFTYVGGGVFGRCRGQETTIRSDSAELYDQSRLYILIGNTEYKEPRVTINAQRATYFRAEERILMEGNVRAVLRNGATMLAPRAEYYRAVRGLRPRAKLVATGRPALSFVDKDSLGRPQPPTNLNANEITADGDSIYIANGKVVLNRTDLVATGDSAYLDNGKQWSRLMKGPVIESKSDQPYTLKGRVIDVYGASRQVNRVVALDSARAVSKDLQLVSDTIDLRVTENKLDRAFAFGPGGSRATTPERDIVADSLDVQMPHQRVRELHAIRKAYAESDPDSSKIVSDERDWLRGDTIIASFDSVPATDTSSKPKVRAILATGSASSYYQVPSNRGEKDKPGVNYVRGRAIRVDFAAGDVQTVTVSDSVSGMYLEAVADTTKATKGKAKPKARPRAGQGGITPRRPSRRPGSVR